MNLFQRFLARIRPLPKRLEPEAVPVLIKEIRLAKLTYCGAPKLENLAEACTRITRDSAPDEYLEAGVALGGVGHLIGQAQTPACKPLFI